MASSSEHLLFFFILHCVFPQFALEDVEVSCDLRETCVLPCPFTPGDDPVIHWTKEPEDIPVHIYYKNRHQLHIQHENYRDRTSVSDQGIRSGDASLQLHKVQVRDEGRYRCYVSTVKPDNVKESFVNLKVYAPVLKVLVHQEGQELICSSERIYPKPTVVWTLSSDSYQTQTSLNITEDGLYTVYSSVRLRPNSDAQSLTCDVSTTYSSESVTVTIQEVVSCRLGQTCVLPCRYEGQLDQVHWTRSPGDYNVHVYVNGRDELRSQYSLYVNRTSLSEDLSRGDASLLISQVTLKDQGRFRCFTISSQGQQSHSLELTVFAPVLEVSVEQQEQHLLCRSEGIYPEPSVVWTPSTEHNTTVTKSEQGLFSVISSVPLSDSEDKYICNVRTAHSWRRAVLKVKELKYELDEWSLDQDGLYTCLHQTDSESVILRLQVERPNFDGWVVFWISIVLLGGGFLIGLVYFIIRCRNGNRRSIHNLKQQLMEKENIYNELYSKYQQVIKDNQTTAEPPEGQTLQDQPPEEEDEGSAPTEASQGPAVVRYRPASGQVHTEELTHNTLEITEANDQQNTELEELMSNHLESMGDSRGSSVRRGSEREGGKSRSNEG